MRHRTHIIGVIGAVGVCVYATLAAQDLPAGHPIVDAKVYDRAAQYLASNQDKLVLNAQFTPHWRSGAQERFTYRHERGEGRADFVEVMAETVTRAAAFDQVIVAAGLSRALHRVVEADRLPFKDYEEISSDKIGFSAYDKNWTCSKRSADCAETPDRALDPAAVPSPDGHWLVFIDNGNLWIRSADGRTRFPLTADAVPHYGYAASVESTAGVLMTGAAARALAVKDGHALPGPPGPPPKPVVLWSTDSRYLFTHRLENAAFEKSPWCSRRQRTAACGPSRISGAMRCPMTLPYPRLSHGSSIWRIEQVERSPKPHRRYSSRRSKPAMHGGRPMARVST
jgi:hypothetical protein